jgi:hypothetical protein
MGALAGTAVVDHFGRRPLLLFASFASTAGMAIVAGLLSPAGPQSTTRANAGISFICTLPAGILRFPRSCGSSIHGILLVRVDATSSTLSRRGSGV